MSIILNVQVYISLVFPVYPLSPLTLAQVTFIKKLSLCKSTDIWLYDSSWLLNVINS